MVDYLAMYNDAQRAAGSQEESAKSMSNTAEMAKNYLPKVKGATVKYLSQLYVEVLTELLTYARSLDKESKDPNVNTSSEAYQTKKRLLGQYFTDFTTLIEGPLQNAKAFLKALDARAEAEIAGLRAELGEYVRNLDP